MSGPPVGVAAEAEYGYTDAHGVRWYHRPHEGWELAPVVFVRQAPAPWWRRALAHVWCRHDT